MTSCAVLILFLHIILLDKCPQNIIAVIAESHAMPKPGTVGLLSLAL